MSSSAIGFQQINKGLTGATGNQGPQGSMGPTGGFGGPIGNTGNIAPFILNVSLTGQTAIVELSDGSQYIVSGNFSGATATDTTTIDIKDPLSPDSDDVTWSLIASGKGTNSFIMRGISGYGSLVVTETSDTIFIDSIYTPSSGSLDSFGLTNNTLVYLKQTDQISSTTIGVTSGNFYDGVLNFEKSNSTSSSPSFSKLLPRSKVKYVSPTYKTINSQPVVLNTDEAGVFYVRTPNGISAFGGSFKSSEVSSFTIITESDDIWNFPSNVYFQNGENYLTCGKSIINLTSFDQGTSWYATVAARGVDASVTNCQIRGVLGSCCYTGVTGARCVDYVTKNQCDILSGTFNPLQACEIACGSTLGVCCSNGQCIEDANYAECLAFGGKFLFGVTCGFFGASQDPNATNEFRLCYDRCRNQKVACCKDGVCLGDEFTKIECENILEGVAFVGKACSDVDCCEQNVKIGACCKNQQCSQKTLNECKADGGVFMGEGELCENINCKCIGSPSYGYCCKCVNNNRECSVTLQENCSGGVWTTDSSLNQNSICPPNICLSTLPNCQPGSNLGSCCYCEAGKQATICEEISQVTCADLDGNFTLGGSCTPTTCNPCTSNDGRPCADCVVAVPGVCCKCDDPNNFCIETDDIKTCPSGYTPNNTTTRCTDNPCGCNSSSICDNREEFFSIEGCPIQTSEFNINNAHLINSKASSSGVLLNKRAFSISSSSEEYDIKYGIPVKDFYIDIDGPGFHKINDGQDLQFCLDLDLDEFITDDQTDQSVRVYILRTWYPKFFVQNYANYKNFSYSGVGDNFDPASQIITKIPARTDFNENSSTEDGRYWGYLAELDLSKGSTAIFSKEDALNEYIHKNQQYSIKHYKDSYNITPSFTTDDLRYELNCPLFGLNTRGKGINELTSTVQGVNSTVTISNIFNAQPNFSSPGNIYPAPNETDSLRYYHSTDIGIRYTDNSNIVPTTMNYNISYNSIMSEGSVLGLTFIKSNNSIGLSRYLLINKSVVNLYDLENNVKLYRFAGYNDFGVEKLLSNSSTYDKNADIGYYTWQAIVNNFENLGGGIKTNGAIKDFNVGHPLTMDYDGDFVVDAFNKRTAVYNDINEKQSPVRATKNSAIIFDSGPITRGGNKIVTIKTQEFINLNNKPDASYYKIAKPYTTEIYNGAINNPADIPNGRRYAKTIGKYLVKDTQNGPIPLKTYNFCVTLPNYKDYIFDPSLISDQSENLINGDLADFTKGRFTNFANKLRVVVFSNAHEPLMNGSSFSSYELLTNQNEFKSIKYLATKYTGRLENSSTLLNQGSYKIKFNDPNLCQNQNDNCELCSDYINSDYESNSYAIFDSLTFDAFWGYCRETTFDPSTGLAEFGPLCFYGSGFNSVVGIMCNCGNNINCSCKGESLFRAALTEECAGADQCSEGCDGWWGGGGGYARSPYWTKISLLSSGITFINFPVFPYQVENSSPSVTQPYSGFLTKLKPYKFTPDGITYYTNFESVFINKKSLCDGYIASEDDGCRSPNSKKQTSSYIGKFYPCDPVETTYFPLTPYGYDTTNEPVLIRRASNKCIFPTKTCNFNSENREQDLQKVAENIFTDITTNWQTAYDLFYTATYDHQVCGAITPDVLRNYPEVVQGTCPTAFTDNFINKLVPTPDGDICIPLECSVIDCSQYQDCSPS